MSAGTPSPPGLSEKSADTRGLQPLVSLYSAIYPLLGPGVIEVVITKPGLKSTIDSTKKTLKIDISGKSLELIDNYVITQSIRMHSSWKDF